MLNPINVKLAILQAPAHVSGAQEVVRCVSQNAPYTVYYYTL
jgi:hypothetical protein